jgi:hypothetical protein
MTDRAWAVARALVAAAGLGAAAAARGADNFEPDDDVTTGNALFHGSEQVHTMHSPFGVDQDWYAVTSQPFSSHQVVVHGLTGDLDLTSTGVQLMNAAGTAVAQSALVLESGGVLSLQWHVGLLSAPVTNFVRVHGPSCGLQCTDDDSYRISVYDSTYTVPRVNNSGTQATVLLVQNATDRNCDAAHHYFAADGTYVASGPLIPLGAHALAVVPTAATFPGQSGSIRVTHTCGYGGLSGKAVSLESATGFTFDTPLVQRPH